ncbi:MAG TPA: AraC family transcriptional regulator [Rhizobiaceae bacterium]|nr:AraC family transcriptional regulator [Rhizobiaceae bacterium]
MPGDLTENPKLAEGGLQTGLDVLSSVLATIRLSGSLQFCFMPTGDWQTDEKISMVSLADGKPAGLVIFHIVAEGRAWVKMEGRLIELEAGDVVVFPHRSPHDLGGGDGSMKVNPVDDLPPKPWREVPTMRYGQMSDGARILCGFLRCEALAFTPLKAALPNLIHIRTRGLNDNDWLGAAVRQLIAEVDRPRAGGVSMLERLTEVMFVEILRQRILMAESGATGWLAALADPALARCIALIHDEPMRDWTVEELATAAGLSRSTLSARFQEMLDTSPVKYVRDWRLYLAGIALATTNRPVASIAFDAGYGTEAAFSRAFSRYYHTPPAAWREQARA